MRRAAAESRFDEGVYRQRLRRGEDEVGGDQAGRAKRQQYGCVNHRRRRLRAGREYPRTAPRQGDAQQYASAAGNRAAHGFWPNAATLAAIAQ